MHFSLLLHIKVVRRSKKTFRILNYFRSIQKANLNANIKYQHFIIMPAARTHTHTHTQTQKTRKHTLRERRGERVAGRFCKLGQRLGLRSCLDFGRTVRDKPSGCSEFGTIPHTYVHINLYIHRYNFV